MTYLIVKTQSEVYVETLKAVRTDRQRKHSGSIPSSLSRSCSLTPWCSPHPGRTHLAARFPIWQRSEVDYLHQEWNPPALSPCWRWSRRFGMRRWTLQPVRCFPLRSEVEPTPTLAGSRTSLPSRKVASPCWTQSISRRPFGRSCKL